MGSSQTGRQAGWTQKDKDRKLIAVVLGLSV
jgi:hypothetical protein